MGISVVLKDLAGEVLMRLACPYIPVVSWADRTEYPILGHVDPYGNTIYNRGQMETLMTELERVRRKSHAAMWMARRLLRDYGKSARRALRSLIDIFGFLVTDFWAHPFLPATGEPVIYCRSWTSDASLVVHQGCTCRKSHPCWSGGMLVFVQDAAQAVASGDAEAGEFIRVGDRCGHGVQWSGVGDALVGSVLVVVTRTRAARAADVAGSRSVSGRAVRGGRCEPSVHDRVHAGHTDTAEYDGDASIGEDSVERPRVLSVPVADQIPRVGAGVFQVHDQVAGDLRHPGRGRMGGGAEDSDASAGVFDHGQHVHPGAGERDGLEEVAGEQRVGLGAQKGSPGGGRAVCAGSMPAS